MEALVGQTQRSMILFLSGRSCLFSGTQLPLRKLPSSRICRFHGSVWFQNHDERNNGQSLTLSSVGFGNKVAVTMEYGKGSNVETRTSSRRAQSNRIDTVSLRYKVDARVKKVFKDNKNEKLEDMNSQNGLVRTREKEVKKTIASKSEKKKQIIDIDTAVFSATSFNEHDLSPLLLKRLSEEGLTVPTEVQSTAIPAIFKKHDVVIQSYTGSGKTFAYLLPILSEVGPLKRQIEGHESDGKQGIEAVIVAPSRELAMQIVREAEKILGSEGRKCVQQLVGGANRSRQEEALRKTKPSIAIGTPGRIAEISAAGKLHTHACRFLVLDEGDQLLAFNFREDMHRILEHVGKKAGTLPIKTSGLLARRVERQLVMVSATVPFAVLRAASNWGSNPLLIKAKSVAPLESISFSGTSSASASDSSGHTASNSPLTQAAVDSLPPSLEHYYCVCKAQHKVDTLRRCVHALDAKTVIAFMNHTSRLKDVVHKLEARGMTAAELHGGLGKLGRSTTLKNFKNGKVRVLVTNELSARGLDVFDCDLVVNLDLPTDSVHYAHRAGRAGRLAQKGKVVTIAELPEVFVVNKMRRQLGIPIHECEATEGKLVILNEAKDEKIKLPV